MNVAAPKVSICVCTYKRILSLARCIESVTSQLTSRSCEILIIDNDWARSAEPVAQQTMRQAAEKRLSVRYVVEPQQSVSAARNRAVCEARGELIAFIDDDETAQPDWLERLCEAQETYAADGVFGPVYSDTTLATPSWVTRLGIFKRDVGTTGTITPRTELRSGNVLIKRALLSTGPEPFDLDLGRVGGEDWLTFAMLQDRGAKYVSCAEAPVVEVLPPSRFRLRWHLRRGYRGGFVFAYSLTKTSNSAVAFILTVGWIIRGTAGGIVTALKHLGQPTTALYGLALCGAAQFGKLGYWAGWRVEEYRSKGT